MRNFFYLIGQGIRNIFKHVGASLFSLMIMIFTIFLFDAASAIMLNINSFVKDAEENVGVTIFFDEGLSESEIRQIGEKLGDYKGVQRMKFTSAEEAWENYKKVYFSGNEHLADGYADNNPLANSASYEVFLKDISKQMDYVEYAKSLKGVRLVNYSNVVAEGLSNVAAVIRTGTIIILVVLLVVAVSLISNSIALTISMRQEEIHIMRYIGASNGFIRSPLVLEGVLIGLIGAAIPLAVMWFGYPAVVDSIKEKYANLVNIFGFISREELFRFIAPVSLVLGVGIGLAGSLFSIKKHLKA